VSETFQEWWWWWWWDPSAVERGGFMIQIMWQLVASVVAGVALLGYFVVFGNLPPLRYTPPPEIVSLLRR